MVLHSSHNVFLKVYALPHFDTSSRTSTKYAAANWFKVVVEGQFTHTSDQYFCELCRLFIYIYIHFLFPSQLRE